MTYIIGVDDVSKKVKDIAVGADDTAKFIRRGYIGVDGVARKFYDRGSYQKRLYFFGNTTTSGNSLYASKLYSVTSFGLEPMEYDIGEQFLVYCIDYTNDFPAYATWDNIYSAKMFYDPATRRLCVASLSLDANNYLNRVTFFTIDCGKNKVLDKTVTTLSVQLPFVGVCRFYYSYEMGCVFFGAGDYGVNKIFEFRCYDIRNSTIKSVSTSSDGFYYITGLFATPTSNGAKLSVIAKYRGSRTARVENKVYSWDFSTDSIISVTPAAQLPSTNYGSCFIVPHQFYNKAAFGEPFGVCFVGTTYSSSVSSYTSSSAYIITKDGYAGSSLSIPDSPMVFRNFGFSNTHGAVWIQGDNGVSLGKYGTTYSTIANPTGGMSNNSGRTYEGPVIGGSVITGYTNANTAVIYANVSGSYYNITPASYGAFNTPICEGVNLKEVLIPNGNQFLVYDFEQVAYTSPISVASAISEYGLTEIVPYVAILSWTKEEQDARINLGY